MRGRLWEEVCPGLCTQSQWMHYSYWSEPGEWRINVSNTNTGLSALINQLSRNKVSVDLELSKYIQPLLLHTGTDSNSSASENVSSSGLKTLAEGSEAKVANIRFGTPSSNVTSTSSSGSTWEGLLSSTLSGGLSSVLGGGLGSIAGLGGLISSITSLFGGSSNAAPPPLALFSLPDSIQQTSYVSSKSSSDVSASGRSSASAAKGSAIYTSTGLTTNTTSSSASSRANNAGIAQAVKSALLSSSTLGDVIAEL